MKYKDVETCYYKFRLFLNSSKHFVEKYDLEPVENILNFSLIRNFICNFNLSLSFLIGFS